MSLLSYPGGKSKIANIIVEKMPEHEVYVEPFFGAGHVFFRKKPSGREVISDKDSRLMRFYREARDVKNIRCDMTPSRERFNRLRDKANPSFCDYLYVNKNSYDGGMRYYAPGREADCATRGDPSSCKIEKFKANPEKIQSRLRHAKIEAGDFKDKIRKYDGENTFFYLDPPYNPSTVKCLYNATGGCDVTPRDVFDAVKDMKGKFLLSYNDDREVRKTFCKRFSCQTVKTSYEMGKNERDGKAKPAAELLIKNF